jgi:hypothetical protein
MAITAGLFGKGQQPLPRMLWRLGGNEQQKKEQQPCHVTFESYLRVSR